MCALVYTIFNFYLHGNYILLQPEVCGSISSFMAFVHKSVNEMSQQYLANERRYNYTTPKSFLELVKKTLSFIFVSRLVYHHLCYCILDQPVSILASKEAWGVDSKHGET